MIALNKTILEKKEWKVKTALIHNHLRTSYLKSQVDFSTLASNCSPLPSIINHIRIYFQIAILFLKNFYFPAKKVGYLRSPP